MCMNEPTDILNQLQSEIRQILHQDESNNREGMDLGILTFQKNKNSEQDSYEIRFSGAKRPLFYCSPQGNGLVKGTRKSVGGMQNIHKNFELNVLEMPVGTTLYLFTDGFADQNNSQRNSFSEGRLTKYLAEIHEKSMKEQKILLDNILDEYSFNTNQRDDILLTGFRLA